MSDAGACVRPLLWRLDVPAPFPIWHVDPAALALANIATLTPEERARAAQFRNPDHARRYLAAHSALRVAVESASGIPRDRQVHVRDPLGCWRMLSHPDWHLSLTYAGASAFVAVAAGRPIGIDCEIDRPVDGWAELAQAHFAPTERAAFTDCGDTGARMFLRGWTRKEACLKLLGTGLQKPPASIETGWQGPCQLRTDRHLIALDSFELPGFIGAWAFDVGAS